MNTAPPEGVKLLKPKNEIEKMGDESEVVHSSGLLNRYMKIPSSLENVTLADWAALYDSPQKPFVKKSKDINKDNLPLERADDEENDDELPDCQRGHAKYKTAKTKAMPKAHIRSSYQKCLVQCEISN